MVKFLKTNKLLSLSLSRFIQVLFFENLTWAYQLKKFGKQLHHNMIMKVCQWLLSPYICNYPHNCARFAPQVSLKNKVYFSHSYTIQMFTSYSNAGLRTNILSKYIFVSTLRNQTLNDVFLAYWISETGKNSSFQLRFLLRKVKSWSSNIGFSKKWTTWKLSISRTFI